MIKKDKAKHKKYFELHMSKYLNQEVTIEI